MNYQAFANDSLTMMYEAVRALGPCRFRLYRHNRCRSLLSTCEGLLQGLKFTG